MPKATLRIDQRGFVLSLDEGFAVPRPDEAYLDRFFRRNPHLDRSRERFDPENWYLIIGMRVLMRTLGDGGPTEIVNFKGSGPGCAEVFDFLAGREFAERRRYLKRQAARNEHQIAECIYDLEPHKVSEILSRFEVMTSTGKFRFTPYRVKQPKNYRLVD